jgi:predicted NACHT family NTPase
MFDGLDEVADPVLRHAVAEWVERQVQVLGANRFLVSSRPNGYRGNQIAGFSLLKVLPFRHAQVERFVSNWYLANEVMAHQKDDAGVRADAKNCADELLRRLSQMPTLQELAVNPLLLTLIATVHRYRSELPGRRVELYAEICDVFLGKRQRAKGIELDLTPAQKVRVLRVLAYYMMNRGTSEIGTEEAEKIIAEALMRVDPQASPAAFLKMVEDSSGLLLAQECDSYGFAHKTFQEYLASLHVKEEGIEKALLRHCSETWWNETIRLYVAQADGSAVVSACIAQDRPPLEALLLATDCAREALELRTDLRDRLRHLTEESLEDSDPERRRLAAEVTLAQRLKNMVRVQDDVFFDHSPVTYAE